jgi:serine/threonine-protein kinase HipA
MSKPGVDAHVSLGDRQVGTLSNRAGRVAFHYSDRALERPVLGLHYEYDPRRVDKAPGGQLPSWFANLLPERESGLRRFFTAQLGLKHISDFALLVHLGQDLPGAVRVATDDPHFADRFFGGGPDAQRKVAKMSFSLAGMQVKLSMRQTRPGEYRYMGVGGDWIVKFPSGKHDLLPENENAMMTWARLSGMNVPEHHLVSPEHLQEVPPELIGSGGSAFAVRRFDRNGDERVHQEDFAQVFDLLPFEKDRGSAEAVGRVIARECPDDMTEFVRRLTACVVMGNTDEHLKNWSLQYPDGRARRLSPAYDLVSVTSYDAFRRDVLTLPIADQADPAYISLDHFRRFADALSIDAEATVATARETAALMADSWPEVMAECPVPPFVAQHVESRLRSLPLVKAR